LRQDYERFRALGAEVIAIGPDGVDAFRRYWAEHQIPFPGLADPGHRVASVYGQEVKWLKLGRLPAVIIVDREGIVRAAFYGESMRDLPSNERILAILAALASSGEGPGCVGGPGQREELAQ
jgi:peroxiredoxin Q/BCP